MTFKMALIMVMLMQLMKSLLLLGILPMLMML